MNSSSLDIDFSVALRQKDMNRIALAMSSVKPINISETFC